jgi:haloacetate dehalogenase
MFEGFTHQRVPTEHGKIAVVQAGVGPAVLLLHGFPQTHVAWHRVAPRLAKRFTIVAADLPGYGASDGPLPDPDHEHYSKRTSARTLASAMRALGFERFAVVGHDRGARVAYRMALDQPQHIRRLVLLDIVPSLEMAERCSHDLALKLANWYLLAQPAPLPETLIGRTAEFYINHLLDHWLAPSAVLDPDARAAYVQAFRDPAVLSAACEDYRAGVGVDIEHDRADRQAGRRITCPLLVLWSVRDLTGTFFTPLDVWRQWGDDVQGRAIEAGHFLMEEAPDEVSVAMEEFLASDDGLSAHKSNS